VTRFILAVCLVLSAATAFAQAEAPLPEAPLPERDSNREFPRDRVWRDWDDWPSRGDRDGVHLRILGDYRLDKGATAREPVVVLGGNATIDGHVQEDVVVIGGRLRLGPTAVIDGDVFTAGHDPMIDPGAHIKGKVDQAVVDLPDVIFGGDPWNLDSEWWRFAPLGATVLRLGVVLTIAVLLTLIAPGWIRSMAGRASSTASAGVLGAVAEVLFVPAIVLVCVALLISVIGIPLLAAIPVVIAFSALLWVGGFAAVAVALGARLRGSRGDRTSVPFLDLLTGFLAITGVSIFANFVGLASGVLSPFGSVFSIAGLVIEYAAWTVGLGAALSTFVMDRRRVTPPLPTAA
jgi:hypothetical protein